MTGANNIIPSHIHSFVVLAYKESPYLEECLHSLKGQSVKSSIFLATSTPSLFLNSLAERYGIPLIVNKHREGIAADWNFAYNAGNSRYVTLAHQDDIYARDYAEQCLAAANSNPDALIIFTDYTERIGNSERLRSRNLAVKRCILRSFFAERSAVRSSRGKKWMLSLGNPISCPSVLFHRERIGTFEFERELYYNLDWDAWLRLARREGSFVYVKKTLMSRRIHGDSELVKGTADKSRNREDELLFERFWPAAMAKLLTKVYSLGYEIGKERI